jgi:hypothetical protein
MDFASQRDPGGRSAAKEAVSAAAAKMPVSNNAQMSRINCPPAPRNWPAGHLPVSTI